MEYKINIFQDKEADVWIATSEDVRGLVLEAHSIDILIERVTLAVPELLSLNKVTNEKSISLCFIIRCNLIDLLNEKGGGL